jgi:hypothetical protein
MHHADGDTLKRSTVAPGARRYPLARQRCPRRAGRPGRRTGAGVRVTPGVADGPNVGELRLLLDELLNRWDQGPEEARLRREQRPLPWQVMVVLGLAAHTHRLGHAVKTLLDQGLQLESAPTVSVISSGFG